MVAEDELLALAAAVEADSEHPLARAIVQAAQERELHVPKASDFRAIAGRGVEATVDGGDGRRLAGRPCSASAKLEVPAALGEHEQAMAGTRRGGPARRAR